MRENVLRFARFLTAAVLLFTLLPSAALAAEEETPPFDGYIFKLADTPLAVSTLSADDPEGLPVGIEPLEFGYFYAETLEDLAALELGDLLTHVEPNYLVYLLDTPNDPYYTSGRQWNLDQIDMSYAWEHNIDGTGVTVGVIDSGLYRGHEDLDYTKVLPGCRADFPSANHILIDDPASGTYYSENVSGNGHGTLVASIIASTANNGKGTAGIAPGVELMPLRYIAEAEYTDETGDKVVAGGIKNVVAVLNYGVENGCDVINMSIGVWGKVDSDYFRTAINLALEKGVILVASAGNGEKISDSPVTYDYTSLCYPAAYEGVIGVAALAKASDYTAANQKVTMASYSQRNASVDITAPGSAICGMGTDSASSYVSSQGTSFSGPTVAAAAALCKQADPDLTAEGFLDLVKATAKQPDGTTHTRTDEYGYGMLNVSDLLRAIREGEGTGTVTAAMNADNTALTVTGENLVAQCRRVVYDCDTDANNNATNLTMTSDLTAIAAAYDSDGKLLASATQSGLAPDANTGVVNVTLTIGAQGLPAKVEVTLVDTETWAPQASPWVWTAPPADDSTTP